jgi:membrane-associated protease RseP (regulator of RpoE activity)
LKLAGPAANVLLGTFVYFLSASLVPGVNDAFREEPTRIAKAAASDLIRVSALPFVVAEKVLTLDIPDNSQGQDAMTIYVTESVPGSGVYSVTDGRGDQIDEFDIGPDYSGRADHFEKKIQQSIDEQLVEPASQESYSGTISGYLNRLAAISLLVGSFNLLPFPGSDGFGAACSAVNGAVSKIRRRKWQLPEQIESMGWTQFIPLCIGLVVLLNLRQLLGYL